MKKPFLLYVDDDPNDLLLLEGACREADISFELKTINDGEAAIRFLEGLPDPDTPASDWPALVLLDIKMPRIGGFDLLEWIRKRPELRGLPVIIFTSSKHDVDIHRAYELGANSYLVKAVDFRELIRMVQVLDQYWICRNQMAVLRR